jgi:hypothetical protein
MALEPGEKSVKKGKTTLVFWYNQMLYIIFRGRCQLEFCSPQTTFFTNSRVILPVLKIFPRRIKGKVWLGMVWNALAACTVCLSGLCGDLAGEKERLEFRQLGSYKRQRRLRYPRHGKLVLIELCSWKKSAKALKRA